MLSLIAIVAAIFALLGGSLWLFTAAVACLQHHTRLDVSDGKVTKSIYGEM